jgi:hypothetical protein
MSRAKNTSQIDLMTDIVLLTLSRRFSRDLRVVSCDFRCHAVAACPILTFQHTRAHCSTLYATARQMASLSAFVSPLT